MSEKQKLRIGFVGCGSHATRSVYPCLIHCPIELVAVCDLDEAKARANARNFGGERVYSDHKKMLASEKLDAVICVVGPRVYPQVALDAFGAGLHVYIEKPPANNAAEMQTMADAARKAGKVGVVAFKKCFAPAYAKCRALIGSEQFGALTSLYCLALGGLSKSKEASRPSILDYFCHWMALADFLMGGVRSVRVEERFTEKNGTLIVTLRSASGAVGTLHFGGSGSGIGARERLEIFGEGAHAVVENQIDLTLYRRGGFRYGAADNYIVPDENAALRWQPEFSLSQLSNKVLFLEGFVQELRHFCDAALTGQPPTVASFDDAVRVMKLYDAIMKPSGEEYVIK